MVLWLISGNQFIFSSYVPLSSSLLISMSNLSPMMKFFEGLVNGRFCIIFCMVLHRKLILHNLLYGHPETINFA
jgi:hypothetical protein